MEYKTKCLKDGMYQVLRKEPDGTWIPSKNLFYNKWDAEEAIPKPEPKKDVVKFK